METQFQKNRSIHNSMCRYKKDSEGKTVLNGCLIYAEGRYRTPGTKYTSYSIKSTPRNSAQGSRKSLHSAKSQKSNISDRQNSGRPNKPKPRERSSTSMNCTGTPGSRYNSENKTGTRPVERLKIVPKPQTVRNTPLGSKMAMPN